MPPPRPAAQDPDSPDPGQDLARRRWEFLARSGALFAASLDVEETLKNLTSLVVPALADWCFVDLVAEDGSVRSGPIACADPGVAAALRELNAAYPPAWDSPRPQGEALRTGQPVVLPAMTADWLATTFADRALAARIERLHVASALVVPLIARGRTLGVISFAVTDPARAYGPADLTLARELAGLAALALDNARLYAAAERDRRSAERSGARVARLQAVSAALAETLTEEEVVEVLIGEGIAALGAEAGSIVRLEPDALLRVVRAVGYEPEVLARWAAFPLDADVPLAEAVRTREPVWIANRAERDRRYPRLADSGPRGYEAVAALPLIVEGRAVGSVGLSFAKERVFAEDDRGFATALVGQCAQALHRARLYAAERATRAEAERSARRFAFLAEAGVQLSTALDESTLLEHLGRIVVSTLADGCVFDMIGEGAPWRRVFAGADPERLALAREIETCYPLDLESSANIVVQVLRSGQPHLMPEIPDELLVRSARDERHLALLRRLGLTSHLIVPLVARGRTLGAMTLVAAGAAGRRYDEDDLALAVMLARRAALAIDNVRLFNQQIDLFNQQIDARGRIDALAAERAAVLGQIADGVIITDATGRIVFVNDAAERLHGTRALDVPVEGYSAAYHLLTLDGQPYPPEALPLARAVLHGETVLNADWRIRRPDGSEVIAQGSATPVRNAEGQPVGAVLTMRDVTAQWEFERQRADFIATASHDLKTPLTTIKGWGQILLGRARSDPTRSRDAAGLAAIVAQATAMQRLIDQLLEASLLTLGQEPALRRAPVDLAAVARELAAQHQALTDRHELRVLAEEPVVGDWDPDRIEQIVTNLLSNAIKYSPDGGAVEVRAERSGDEARLTVRDRGIGIPPEAMDRLFERYFRIHPHEGGARQWAGGTGLGLFSARQTAERHGGRIEVESVVGEGSLFTLVLPLRDTAPVDRAADAGEPGG